MRRAGLGVVTIMIIAVAGLTVAPAQALTLTATGGSLGLSHFGEFELGGQLTGDDWSLLGGTNLPCCFWGPASESFGFMAWQVTRGGVTTAASGDLNPNGSMTFVRAAAPPEPDCSEEIGGRCIPWSAAFTMTGHIEEFGGFDLIGQGRVTHGLQISPFGDADYFVRYDFHPATTVPEPATVVLVAAGLGGVLGLWRARRV
jgi:PEP-CTERM motif